MSKVSYKFKNGKVIISNRLVYPEQVNEKVFGELSRSEYKDILPLERKSRGRDTVLSCEISGAVPLKEYFSDVMSKKVFLNIVERLIGVIKYCSERMLNTGNLYLTEESVFISPTTSRLTVIYWPVVNNMLSLPAGAFFKELINDLQLAREDDHFFVSSYKEHFSSGLFSLNEFERFIKELIYGAEPLPERAPDEQKQPVVREEKGIAYDPFSAVAAVRKSTPKKSQVMCPMCGELEESGAAVCSHCGSSLTVKVQQSSHGQQYPALMNTLRGSIYIIDSERYVIGSSAGCSCCIPSSALADRHAMVVFKNGQYFLQCLTSLGTVMLNGEPVGCSDMRPMHLGSSFALADEQFVFTVTDARPTI